MTDIHKRAFIAGNRFGKNSMCLLETLHKCGFEEDHIKNIMEDYHIGVSIMFENEMKKLDCLNEK